MSSSSASSSGDGDGLRCQPIPENQFQDVIEHLRFNFFADEPLNHKVGLCKRGKSHVELERHCLHTLKQGVSSFIVDENGKIAGIALNGIIRKSEREESERRLADLKDEKFKSIFNLLHRVNDKVDIFEKYGVKDIFECRILSVDEAFRGRGLANVLILYSIKTARKSGFKVMKADATGIFSQKVFLKYGFEVITEIPYKDVEENLRPGPPHEALKLMVKILD